MIKKIIYIIGIYAIALPCSGQNASTPQLIKAEEHFANMEYMDAIEQYTKATETAPNAHVYARLADSHLAIGNTIEAEQWYSKALDQEPDNEKYILKYAQILQRNEGYEESMALMKQYNKLKPEDTRGTMYLESSEALLSKIVDDKFSVTNALHLNSKNRDFSPIMWKDHLIFTSSRDQIGTTKRKDKRDYLPFVTTYGVSLNKDNEKVKAFPKGTAIKYNQGPLSIDSKGICYITVSNGKKGKLKVDEKGISQLKIVKTQINDRNAYGEFEDLSINVEGYSTGHPALSPNEKTLYFTSNMPGGYGGTDLYEAELKEDGSLGKAKNLGADINTEGNEMFPYVSEDGNLFFSSEGHVGFGGLDLFIAKSQGDNFSKPENLGGSINSSKDDFGLMFKDAESGYFSSNRSGGEGLDDIYAFTMYVDFIYDKILKGVAKNQQGEPLAEMSIELYDTRGKLIDTVTTDPNGNYSMTIKPDKEYQLTATKKMYIANSMKVSSKTEKAEIVQNIVMEKNIEISLYCLVKDKTNNTPLANTKITLLNRVTGVTEVIKTSDVGDFTKALDNNSVHDEISYTITLEKEGYLTKKENYIKKLNHKGVHNIHEDLKGFFDMDKIDLGIDLATIINVQPIYFDYGKFNIKEDAAKELDKIVKVMQENPTMKIELGSHTDARGSSNYNMNLSDQRAKASASYIKKSITNPERIVGKGYGESALINRCADNVECSEEEHQQNRRTEFRIIN